MNQMIIEKKRDKLIKVLTGNPYLLNTEDIEIKTEGHLHKQSDVWIEEVSYDAYFPTLQVDEGGDILKGVVKKEIPAFLLSPSKGMKVDCAVLAAHQHNLEYELGGNEPAGLAGNPDLHYGLELAQRGMVVLAPDFLPFGKRFYQEKEGLPRLNEQYANQTCQLNGYTYLGNHVLTAVAGITALIEYAKTENVGMIGHAFGALITTNTTAADKRIKAAAVISGGAASLDEIDKQEIPHNMAIPVSQYRRKLGDTDTLIGLIAGEGRYLMAFEGRDNLDVPGNQKMVERARRVYEIDDQHLILNSLEKGEVFPKKIRDAAYNFLKEKLNG